jgi:putative ABC transport system permease protein
MARFLNWLPWRRRRLEQELARELGYHVDRRVHELTQQGVPESRARRQVAMEFGGLPQVQEEVRDTWTWRWLDTFARDVRYSVRTLMGRPGFTVAAVLSLALAIGANTAIFSVVRGVLLKPLPYAAPHELVTVWQDLRAKGGPLDEWATPGNFVDWRAESRVFKSMASMRGFAPVLTGMGDAEMLVGEQVTESYFDVLGAAPIKGRVFRPEEMVPNAPRVVILSHKFWRERFGGADDVLSKQLMLSGEAHQIVGVMGQDFRPFINLAANVWRPDRLNLATPSRGAIVLRIIARLQPGVGVEEARAAAATMAADLSRRYPQTSANAGISVIPLHERVVGDVRPGMLMLLGAVLLVLLIACVNVANLLLARATGRAREIAVRVAIGAGRGRVVQQLLTESVVLAMFGGAAGVLLSFLGLKAFIAMAPAGTPRLDEISIDASVLGLSAGLTVLTGLLFGLVPALQLARTNHSPSLKDGARGASGASGHGLRRVLVVAEMAIALMLLVAGGLLMRSFAGMQNADLGFNPAGVTAAFVQVPASRFPTPPESIAFEDRLLERVRAVPGVTRAAWTSILPLAPGGDNDMDFTIEGVAPPPPDQPGIVAWFRVVSDDYLSLMGMRVRSGRGFERREAQPVVVISQTLASRYFKDAEPVGRRVQFGLRDGSPWYTIVGVVDDVRSNGARAEARGQMFIPYWHAGRLAAVGLNLVVKTDAAPDVTAQALTQAVREIDPLLPVTNVRPMTTLLGQSVEEPRFLAAIAGTFAILAMLLAAIGVYGVMAYAVTARQKEIGVRLALGASRRDVFGLMYSGGLKLMIAGVVLGAAGAATIAPALRTLLYGLEPLDAATFATMGVVLLATSGLAVLIPATRATRVDPVATLRD